jgi:hypothetical protein
MPSVRLKDSIQGNVCAFVEFVHLWVFDALLLVEYCKEGQYNYSPF